MDAPTEEKHPFWKAIEAAAVERSPETRALAAAVLLMSTRGDIYLKDEEGNETPCSSMTMERIFDALVRMPLFDLIKKQESISLVNGNVIRYPMTMPAIPAMPDPTSWLGLSRSKYPGRLSVPLRSSQNLLHAPATPENVMEFIDGLENVLDKKD